MTSRSSGLNHLLRGMGCLVALGIASPSARAQGGFGPDPYRPYNNQYDAFVYPSAPGRGDVVPSEAALSRQGLSRNNQYQEYLRNSGGGPTSSTRSRGQMDEATFRDFQYQPNRKVDEESGFNKKQEVVSQTYFAYLREKDPKRRAELLKEYQQTRLKPEREFSANRTGVRAKSRVGTSASKTRSDVPLDPRSKASSSGTPRVPPLSSRTRSAQGGSTSLFGSTPIRGNSSSSTDGSTTRKPSDVLEDSLKRDRRLGLSPPSTRSNGSTSAARSRSRDRIPPAPPRRSSLSPSSAP